MHQKNYSRWIELSVRGLVLGASTFLIGVLTIAQIPLTAEKSSAESEKSTPVDSLQDLQNLNRAPRASSGSAWIAKFNGATAAPVWVEQFGGTSLVTSQGAAADAKGNILITGGVYGDFAGNNKGLNDAWVAKLNPSGSLIWKRQLGTSDSDESNDVAIDAKGNVIIAGNTEGDLAGRNQGDDDIFVAKYNPAGTLIWKIQLGSSLPDTARGVTTDSSGNIYITGDGLPGPTGSGSYAAKLSPAGKLLWATKFGSLAGTDSYGVATDTRGNVYLSGQTKDNLGGTNKGDYDAWVAKINSAGSFVWIKQLGTSNYDGSRSVATDANGNVYISGGTLGKLSGNNKGVEDAWVAKYTAAGSLSWIQQLGTSSTDRSYSVATDSSGNAFISGITLGNLGGTSSGNYDAWVSKYSPNGVLKWTKQIGSPLIDLSLAVTTDKNGDVFITGLTAGDIPNP